MCVQFTSNAASTTTQRETACLCAQFADAFTPFFRGEDTSDAARADLAAHARPGCFLCHGTGIELVDDSDEPVVEWSNDNAAAICGVLGFRLDCNGGSMPVADARRGVMRARARGSVAAFERPALIEHGAPRELPDGSVELRPVRAFGCGLDAEGIRRRVEQFAAFVEACAERGATTIYWS